MRILCFDKFLLEKMAPGPVNPDFIEAVSKAYEEAPDKQPGVERHWEALKKSNARLYKQILSKYKVEFTEDDPYQSATEMRREVEDSGVLKIFSGNADHPYFSKDENLIFRAVHDYYTHIIHGEDFSTRGELRAYNTHSKLVPPDALPALFTEVIGQVCYFITNGKFPETQKLAVLKGFDFKVIGAFS